MKWDRNCSFQKDRTEIAKIEKSSLEREDWGNGSDSSPFFRRTFWALLLIFSFFFLPAPVQGITTLSKVRAVRLF